MPTVRQSATYLKLTTWWKAGNVYFSDAINTFLFSYVALDIELRMTEWEHDAPWATLSK